jgi:hypothetical protein
MVSVERKTYQRKAFSAKKNARRAQIAKAHFSENAQQRKVKLRNAK